MWYMVVVVIAALTLSPSDCVTGEVPRTIKSNAVTHVSLSGNIHSQRHRRQAQPPLTPRETSEIVDHHNALRAREGADNMELMLWNNFLASLAAKWAAGCNWRHGQPPLGDDPPYTSIGQNLYATTGNFVNLTSAIQLWYDEKPHYTYDTLKCADGEMCGHYTQVVWATSRHVGCAYQRCRPLTGAYSRAVYLVCNYAPAGNYVGAKPFTKGPACSRCGSGAGWCKNRLCNSACSGRADDCSCAAICYNCASLSFSSCRCSCADGWHGSDCSVRCEDTHRWCGVSPGWPNARSCGASYVRRGCPAMCKLCTKDPDAKEGRCPPFYGPAAPLSAPMRFIAVQHVSLMSAMVFVALTISRHAH